MQFWVRGRGGGGGGGGMGGGGGGVFFFGGCGGGGGGQYLRPEGGLDGGGVVEDFLPDVVCPVGGYGGEDGWGYFFRLGKGGRPAGREGRFKVGWFGGFWFS